jgi:hypothetical protein
MKPTSKTPYEIRLELLQLAQTILDAQHKARNITQATHTAPTSEEVLAEAEKLNAFVSKANTSH